MTYCGVRVRDLHRDVFSSQFLALANSFIASLLYYIYLSRLIDPLGQIYVGLQDHFKVLYLHILFFFELLPITIRVSISAIAISIRSS